MISVPPLFQARNAARFILASLRNGTVRYYVGDLPGFYQALNAAGIAYVVLRWSERVPMTLAAEQVHVDDIDHLVADRDMRRVMSIAARHPGAVKTDYYSVGGRRGSSYKSLPYYMPELAQRILCGRQLDPRGFFRPSPRDEFFAFAYHLCYHKGLASGLEGGLPACPSAKQPTAYYESELRRLAVTAEFNELPEPLTLSSLHDLLHVHGWAIPADLMTRWPKRHAFLEALLSREAQRAQPLIHAAQRHTVFVLREDCDTTELEQLALSMIAERFIILCIIRLDSAMRDRLVARTRGGSWVEKQRGVVAPTVVVICRDAEEPGPIPVRMSAKKVTRRYPHLSNTDLLIKRNIRDAVNAAAGQSQRRVVVHATDNAFECAEVFSALFVKEALSEMEAILGRKVARTTI